MISFMGVMISSQCLNSGRHGSTVPVSNPRCYQCLLNIIGTRYLELSPPESQRALCKFLLVILYCTCSDICNSTRFNVILLADAGCRITCISLFWYMSEMSHYACEKVRWKMHDIGMCDFCIFSYQTIFAWCTEVEVEILLPFSVSFWLCCSFM